ncbi:MAG: hypothetical protein IIB54_10535 [Planctomycetes bacterium]|nr:hypothetical protein [Planctomycetota bacterium]
MVNIRWGNNAMIRRTLIMVAGLVMLSLFAGSMLALRHPFHVTIAEAQVNINEHGHKVLEVALRVEPDELELAIERRIDRKFKLETAPDADKLIVAYLDDVFRVRHPAQDKKSKPKSLKPCPPPPPGKEDERDSGPSTRPDRPLPDMDVESSEKEKAQPSIIHWIGMEITIEYAWLYFEICLPEKGVAGLEFSNRIFFELEDTQTNTINFEEVGRKTSLSFTRVKPWKRVKFPKPDSP